MSDLRAPRGRWWDHHHITEADAAAQAAVTAYETSERLPENWRPLQPGSCPVCGRESADGTTCIRCDRGAYDAGVRE